MSSKTRMAGAAVGVVVVVAALGGGHYMWRARAARQLARAWRSYEACLLGESLAEGERPSSRIRRIELAQAPTLGTDANVWPRRCRPAAARIKLLLSSASSGDHPELTAFYGPLEWANGDRTTWNGESYARMDRQWGRLPLDALPDVESDASAAPPAARPALATDPARLGPPLSVRDVQRFARTTDPMSHSTVRLLLTAGKPETLCIFESAPDSGRCRELPPPLVDSLSSQLVTAEEGAPTLIQAATLNSGRRRPGIFVIEAERAKLAEPTLFDDPPAFVRASGEILVLRRVSIPAPSGEYLVRRGRAGQAFQDVRLGAPSEQALGEGGHLGIDLVGDWVVWTRSDDDGARQPLYRQVVPEAPALPSAVTELGKVPRASRALAACRSEGTTGLLWGTMEGERHEASLIWSLSDGDVAAESVSIAVGAHLTCAPEMVTVTSMEADAEKNMRAHQVRCSSACESSKSEPLALPIDRKEDVRAASLGSDTVLVWRLGQAAGTDAGVTYVRTGPLSDLHAVADRPLFDNAAHGGIDATGVELFARPDFALAVATTGKGTYAARVSAGGELTPALSR